MTNEQVTIVEGQIWREVDPRFERYVRVMGISVPNGNFIFLRKCASNGDLPKGSRRTEANRERFNGKRGGYELFSTHLVATP